MLRNRIVIGKPASRREEIFERDVKEIIDARIVNEPGRITIAEAHEDALTTGNPKRFFAINS